ncbi:4Fe-4S binding protein [Methanocaldococcus infernus]
MEIVKDLKEIFEDMDENEELLKHIANHLSEIRGKLIYVNESICCKCNLCYKECPVDAIERAKVKRAVKIKDNCIKCEICAKTCPVDAIFVIEGDVNIKDSKIVLSINKKEVMKRKIRLKNYIFNDEKCGKCGICAMVCPTKAIKVVRKKSFSVNLDLCIGCGACEEQCPKKAVKVERELGNIYKEGHMEVDKELCVGCMVCVEECPIDCIYDIGGVVEIDNDKCVLCRICEEVCPTKAIKMISYDQEGEGKD